MAVQKQKNYKHALPAFPQLYISMIPIQQDYNYLAI